MPANNAKNSVGRLIDTSRMAPVVVEKQWRPIGSYPQLGEYRWLKAKVSKKA